MRKPKQNKLENKDNVINFLKTEYERQLKEKTTRQLYKTAFAMSEFYNS